MKLKLLFFPAILIISISIFFGFIIPDWNAVRENADKITEKEERIAKLESKRSNMQKLEQDLKNHQSDEELLYMFLPTEVNQEYIVNNVGRIADSAGVSVSEISFSKDKREAKNPATVRAREKIFQNEESLDLQGSDIVATTVDPELQRVVVSVSLAGEYDLIKAFIEEVESMDVMADVISIELGKIEDEDSNQSVLSGELGIVAYFMDRKVASGNYSEKFLESTSFNYDFVDDIKSSVSKKSADINIERAGSDNPFVLIGSEQTPVISEPEIESEPIFGSDLE